MERDLEKDLMEIETATKGQLERDNMFIASVLQRCHKLVSELKEYKDLEEQGKLLKLPCAVGDMTYYASKLDRRVIDAIVQRIEIDADGFWVITSSGTHSFDDFDKTVFAVKEAAEAALKEMSE